MAKQKFKITNWPAYNKALRQRGSLTVWLDESAIAGWTDSSSPEGPLSRREAERNTGRTSTMNVTMRWRISV
ncbi:IS5/IS1182 family transposase [Aphis craccivora]|uniref:IS5/IS1182 family transposase n=1 Tax=Aphis craccivora TaxID=307492 RepID=A0A6G0XSQ6_APHCR|nr:IS5/IS1182 family transposase [Aphis craccivora]